MRRFFLTKRLTNTLGSLAAIAIEALHIRLLRLFALLQLPISIMLFLPIGAQLLQLLHRLRLFTLLERAENVERIIGLGERERAKRRKRGRQSHIEYLLLVKPERTLDCRVYGLLNELVVQIGARQILLRVQETLKPIAIALLHQIKHVERLGNVFGVGGRSGVA